MAGFDKQSANDFQHGGVHYSAPYQHWDMVVDFQLDYYRANATKYLTRHRKKNGLEDVEKSGHYVDKLIELIDQKRFNPLQVIPSSIETAMFRMSIRYFESNKIVDSIDTYALTALMITHDVSGLSSARALINELKAWYAAQPKPKVPTIQEVMAEGMKGIHAATATVPSALVSSTGGVYQPSPQFTREGYRGEFDCWQCRKCFSHFELPMGTNPEAVHVCKGEGGATAEYVDQAREGGANL